MSSSREVNPQDLTFSDLSSDFELKDGPTIDSSDEFPLPNFEFDEECSVDVLFPIEGEAAEKKTPTSDRSEPCTPASFEEQWDQTPALSPSARLDVERDYDNPINSDLDLPDLPTFGSIKRVASEDEDYLEEGLGSDDDLSSNFPQSVEPSTPLGVDLHANRTRDLDLTEPGPPMASVASSFKKAEPEPQLAEPVPPFIPESEAEVEAEAEEFPVKTDPGNVPDDGPEMDPYIRKVRFKKGGDSKAKVRAWLPAAGVVFLGVAFFASKPFLNKLEGTMPASPVLIVSSQPQGELFAGDRSLGETPVALTADLASGKLEVRKPGYLPLVVPPWENRGDHLPAQKFVQGLKAAPVALAWDGIPQGATVWWNGAKIAPSTLVEAPPGDYSVKVKPADRPSVTLALQVAVNGGPVAIGEKIADELAKQPTVDVGLSLPEKVAAKDLSLSIVGLESNKDFSQKFKVSDDKKASLRVPGPGKYKVSFAGDSSLKPSSQTVELASGGSQEIRLALSKQPPKVEPVASSPSSGSYQSSGAGYRPYYPPPRVYTGGGGSGGGSGGRIAPPSF